MKTWASLTAFVTMIALWLICAIGPTVAIVWIAIHFIRKYW